MIGLDETAVWNLMAGLYSEPVQVGILYPGYMRAIGATTRVVLLSRYTIDHVALGRHRQRYYETLCLIPEIVRKGYCRQIEPRKLAFLYFIEPRKPYRAVVKATKDGKEVYL